MSGRSMNFSTPYSQLDLQLGADPPYNAKSRRLTPTAFQSFEPVGPCWCDNRMIRLPARFFKPGGRIMPNKVRCKQCGFLTVVNAKTRELVSAEIALRELGRLPGDGKFYIYDERPLCFVLAADIPAEMGQHPDDSTRMVAVSRVRECDKLVPWRQGFTPKEHQEMIDRQLSECSRGETRRRQSRVAGTAS